MPFYAPLERFFTEPGFRDVVDDALSGKSVRERGIFDPAAVAALLARMRAGEFIFVKQVFSLVVLELWFRTFLDRRGRLEA